MLFFEAEEPPQWPRDSARDLGEEAEAEAQAFPYVDPGSCYHEASKEAYDAETGAGLWYCPDCREFEIYPRWALIAG